MRRYTPRISAEHPWGIVPLILLAVSAILIWGCQGQQSSEGDSGDGLDVEHDAAITPDDVTNEVTNTPAGTPPPLVAKFIISPGTPDCTVQAEDGTNRAKAPRKSYVLFENQTDKDVILNFGPEKRLLGVLEAIVYPGDSQKFEVRTDAEIGDHGFRIDCRPTQPGAVIEVPPPPGGGGGE